MAYSPPNTFNPNDVVDADLIQENLDEIKKYLNGDMIAGDIETDGWARRNHIVRGIYQPIQQQLRFVSGHVGGRNFSVLAQDLSFLPDAPTAMNAPSTPTLVYQPNCSFDFYLEEDAYVIFQIYANPLTISIPTTGAALDEFVWRIYVDDDEINYTEFKTQWISSGPALEKNFLTTFWADELTSGTHTISIKGYAEAPYAIISAWGIGFETYYKN